MEKRFCSLVYLYLGSAAAYLLFIPVWVAYICGRVRTHWSPNAKSTWRKGGLLLVVNHPSLIETIVLPALFWHPTWLGNTTRIPWSLSDEKLFGNQPWVYRALRCLVVSRDSSQRARRLNSSAIRKTLTHLNQGGIMVLYPEGGRTCKGEIVNNAKVDGRQIRECSPRLVQGVLRQGFTVMPIWVDHGIISTPESFWQGYVKLFFGPKLHIYFGSPMKSEPDEINEMTVAEAILQAGT